MSEQSVPITMEGEENEVRGRKRRNEKEWARNVAKRRRAEGQSYTSSRGKKVDARKTGSVCRYFTTY